MLIPKSMQHNCCTQLVCFEKRKNRTKQGAPHSLHSREVKEKPSRCSTPPPRSHKFGPCNVILEGVLNHHRLNENIVLIACMGALCCRQGATPKSHSVMHRATHQSPCVSQTPQLHRCFRRSKNLCPRLMSLMHQNTSWRAKVQTL